jgi:glutamate synthase (ferredoxin)
VNLEDILAERDACGVGFIASLKNEASYKIVKDALKSLGCMEHRGGCLADNDSGDGAGLMTRIPWELFDKWFKEQGLPLPDRTNTAVGMVFLPTDADSRAAAKSGNYRHCSGSWRGMLLRLYCVD